MHVALMLLSIVQIPEALVASWETAAEWFAAFMNTPL